MSQPELERAAERAAAFRRYDELRAQGYSLRQAALAVGMSPSQFSGPESPYMRWRDGGVVALLPRRRAAKPRFTVPDWFVPAARFFWLLSNRTWRDGSVPEAIRRAISLPALPPGWDAATRARFLRVLSMEEPPECPAELRELIFARQAAGKPLVPDRIARAIRAPERIVRAFRSPTEADLDYACAPGFMRFRRGADGPAFIRAGDVIEPDDGTINFGVVVPWDRAAPIDRCSERWGCTVGRFQSLIMVDAATGYIATFCYVIRPRGSYRAEDALRLYLAFARAHGLPRAIRHEGGVWQSRRVRDAMQLSGIESWPVHSPHAKPWVEGRFNKLWTSLSVLSCGQVGRYRAEMEEEDRLLGAAKRGELDPRGYFPDLGAALRCLEQAVAEANATPMQSQVGPPHVPAERWAEQLRERPLRALDPANEWMFRPMARTWTVRGDLVGGRVPLFEDVSVPFDFSAPWLHRYHGARVTCYFDPWSDSRCQAQIVLAQNWEGERAGTVLGAAVQVNGIADYARLALGYGSGPDDAGRVMRRRCAAAVRREIRAIMPRGRGQAASEQRDGAGRITTLEMDAPAAPDRLRPQLDVPSAEDLRALEEFERAHRDFI